MSGLFRSPSTYPRQIPTCSAASCSHFVQKKGAKRLTALQFHFIPACTICATPQKRLSNMPARLQDGRCRSQTPSNSSREPPADIRNPHLLRSLRQAAPAELPIDATVLDQKHLTLFYYLNPNLPPVTLPSTSSLYRPPRSPDPALFHPTLQGRTTRGDPCAPKSGQCPRGTSACLARLPAGENERRRYRHVRSIRTRSPDADHSAVAGSTASFKVSPGAVYVG